MIQQKLNLFKPAMVAGTEAAIAAEVFYQDSFKEFVLNHMGGYGCAAFLVGVYSINQDVEDFLKTYQKMLRDTEEIIKQSPRGHYAIIERIGNLSRFSMIISDGSADIALGGKYNSYDELPTGEIVLDAMLGQEIYQCRKLVECRNNELNNLEIMEKHKFFVGQTFKNLQSDEYFPTHKFGTTTIVAIRPDMQLDIVSTKRGSKSKWNGLVSPRLLEKMVEWSKAVKPAKQQGTIQVSTLFGENYA